jgi:hypothetical protein
MNSDGGSNNEECGNCKFWRLRSDVGDRGGGYCVRYPPFAPATWVMTREELVAGSGHMNDAWPMTSLQSWCGEYSASKAKSD